MRAIITVIGKDRTGIIAGVTQLLSEQNANVLDISQTILSEFFTMVMLVDVGESSVPFAELTGILAAKGEELGVSIHAQREDIFQAMHRI